MSATELLNSSESENNCVVCFKNVDVFSVGICDHPVCFECSTRMRVLCHQLECPICRQEMPKVVFTKEIQPFCVLHPKVTRLNLQARQYGLYFASTAIERRYYRLLEHECIVCKRDGHHGLFRTFQQLKDHMRRSHELFYCDLCVVNLKIFTFERSAYTRTELATHRRKGDANNTSHRGHPLCEFCETRFMDNDELFRHLRRDHMFCHFCDFDGKHQYYNSYDDLRKHYMEEHYLCEEGDCKFERFTSVFRSDIDLKAHYALVHGKNLSKSANRHARTLEVEFTLAPRAKPEVTYRRQYGNRHNVNRPNEDERPLSYDFEPGGLGEDPTNDRLFNNPLAAENFPSLSGDVSTTSRSGFSNVTITSKTNPLSEENFPSLNGCNAGPSRSSAVTITTSKLNPNSAYNYYDGEGGGAVRQRAVTITRTLRGQQPLQRNSQALQRNSANFPSLPESATVPPNVRVNTSSATSGSVRLQLNAKFPDNSLPVTVPNVSIHVNHKENGAITTHISQTSNGPALSVRPKTTEAFPALSSAQPLPQPQWVQQKAKKQEPKVKKVAAAPVLPSSSLNDFPTLSKGGKSEKSKKSSSITMPISNTWVNLNNFNVDAKSGSSSNISNNLETKQELGGMEKLGKISKNVKPNEIKTGEDRADGKNKNKKKKGKVNMSDDVKEIVSTLDKCNFSNLKVPKTEKISRVEQNGLTKKRSELNIGALEEPEIPEESRVTKLPPGISVKPPPGFNNFNLPNNSLSNDLTFTNSSGQSYSILPTQFYPPSNFKSRNQFLIEKFKTVFRDTDGIQQFKVYSDLFRMGEILPEKYYEHCKSFMGSEFDIIFPELLVLLPNVERQQELYKVHKRKCGGKGLEVCATCKQIVFTNELRNHLSNHVLDNHFPVLSQTPIENNVWNKK